MTNELTKCDAIVLNAVDYKEFDKLLTIFSANCGKQKVILRGCKRPKAKQRFAGQPFFFGEFIIAQGKGYDVVTQVEPKKTFIEITYDYDAYLNASQVLKTIDASSLSHVSERQFLLLLTYLVVLKDNIEKSDILTCKFYIEYLKMQGLELNTDCCFNCNCEIKYAYFDVVHNCIVCENCRTYESVAITNSVLDCLKSAKSNKMLSLVKADFDPKDVKTLKDLLYNAIKRIFY